MPKYLDINGRQVPEPVYDKSLEKLAKAYREAMLSVKQELERADVTALSRAHSLAMLKEIEKTLGELDHSASDWVKENIPQAAIDGVATTLVNLGAVKTMDEALKIVEFNKLNKAMVEHAVADTQADLLQITQNVSRKVRNTVREVVASSMRSNMAAGINGRKTISGDIVQQLRAKLGAAADTGLIDAAGRKWMPETYAEVVTRTKMLETFRAATTNEALDRGAQYGIISRHGASDACRFHEGRIIKLDPSAPGSYPTYEELKGTKQIFHPNCKHHFNVVSNLDRLPDAVKQTAREQDALGRAATATGGRSPDGEVVKAASKQYMTETPPTPKAPKVARISDKYAEAKTVKQATAWASDNLPIKGVDYKGYDLQLANDTNKNLAGLLDKYPEIRNIKYVGTIQNRNRGAKQWFIDDKFNKLRSNPDNAKFTDEQLRNYAEKYAYKPKKVSGNNYAQAANEAWGDYEGVSWNEAWAKDSDKIIAALQNDERNKWHPVGTGVANSVITHEFGHMVDYFLDSVDLRKKYITPITSRVLAMGEQRVMDELSLYAWRGKSPDREVVAEAFAEYIHNPNPRPIAKEIGQAIDAALEEYRGR